MDGYISIQAAIDAVESDLQEVDPLDTDKGIMKACIRRAVWRLEQVQFADVRPVKSGKWEHVLGVCTPGGDPWLRCPFCKDKDSEHLGGIEMPKRWNWCPICGAALKD